MYKFSPPILFHVAGTSGQVCPNCQKKLSYLIDINDSGTIRSINKCPWCDWRFDETFYRNLQNSYRVIEFDSHKTRREFMKEFFKRNTGFGIRRVSYAELVKKYEAVGKQVWIYPEDLEFIKNWKLDPEDLKLYINTPVSTFWTGVKNKLIKIRKTNKVPGTGTTSRRPTRGHPR